MWMLALAAMAAPGDMVEADAEVLWVHTAPGGLFGWITRTMPDIDGDGVQEALVGATMSGLGGRAAVLSGADGTELFSVSTSHSRAELGFDVSDAGDVDGDGVNDWLTGGPEADGGYVYVISGATGATIREHGGEAVGDRLGATVADVDDVDGDGRGDYAIGAPGYAANTGRVTVFSGADGTPLLVMDGDAPGVRFGAGAMSIADMDGDGLRDLILGAPDAGAGQRGQVGVYSSATGSQLAGPFEPGLYGWDLGLWFVGDPGDLDGDGVQDVYAGDFNANSTAGMAVVFSGATGDKLFQIDGEGTEGLGCGREAGDVDGDGVGDLAVGSWQHAGGAEGGGRVSLFSGVDGSVIRTWTSLEPGENLGFDATGIGDADGDGGIDILTSGAVGNNVYVLRGPPPAAPIDAEEPKACGCATPGAASPWLGLLALALTRARRTAAPRTRRGTGR